jgi:tRNA A-37 threonylcarbamoyl transferase component Bud32
VANFGSNASGIRRIGASASSRLTEGLLSSSGRVATITLVAALLTLAFVIWFRVELAYQSEVGTPEVLAAAELDASINASLAALHSWVAYGDPGSVVDRSALWMDSIEPTLARLQDLASRSDQPETVADVAKIRSQLKDLKRIQWAIEVVARTPGNQPAAAAYSLRLAKLRRNIFRGTEHAFEQFAEPGAHEHGLVFLAQLGRFRSAFSEGDIALNRLIGDYSQARETEVSERLMRAREIMTDIERESLGLRSIELRQLFEFIFEEFRAYELQVPELVELRRSKSWNVAEYLFMQEALPLVESARAASGELAAGVARSAAEDVRALTHASYVVIAMVFLVGVLSAGSLLVSYRLRQQVHHVMAKAKTLGQYVIEKRVGGGAMGEVYLAHHAMLRRPTALKLMRPESAENPRAQQRFRQEVQLTCQLTHPNTIQIFDYGRMPEGLFYYAMEYLEGFTLEALVSLVGPVAPARVAHILVQACGSLHEAHQAGLLHRDIKPTNIMLTCQGDVPDTVKVLDFGLVKEFSGGEDDSNENDVIAGTPMYLAPESILSSDTATPRADLYALGAVGYLLLTGKPVFPSDSILEVFARHVEEEPEFPSERLGRSLPEDLECVIMACLAKDPSERPPNAKILGEMLGACDCGSWSIDDARLWWDEYGEAARNESEAEDGQRSLPPTEIEVVVDTTRS